MLDMTDPREFIGRRVYGTDGERLGTIENVLVDDDSGVPEWLTIRTGLFGMHESFVPLATADVHQDGVQVPYDKDRIKDAPRFESSYHLTPEDERELYNHYGISYGERNSPPGYGTQAATGDYLAATTGTTATPGDDIAGTTGTAGTRRRGGAEYATPTRSEAGNDTDDAMTRSEERLRVGTERVETGRARLRKYVVTENVTETVPVTHEEVRVEHEPITDANREAARSGPDLSEAEHEVVLHEERPVVDKETVPVERVRLTTDEVPSEETVSEEVRREEIDLRGAREDVERR